MKIKVFSTYEKYKQAQVKANKKKIRHVFVGIEELDYIKDYIQKKNINITSGICHGARNGFEVKEFRKRFPEANIIGTDISGTASKFPHMIQWDFHKMNDKWESYFDFVYSNSLDHSYDPNLALSVWFKCLKPNAYLFLCWSILHHSSKTIYDADCCSASLEEYKILLQNHHGVIEDEFSYFKRKSTHRVLLIVRKSDNVN